MTQTRIRKPAPERKAKPAEETSKAAPDAERLKAELDAMLDEVDSVLEENAEEFVKNFIQKGGQ